MVIEHLEECLGKSSVASGQLSVKSKAKARKGRPTAEQLAEIRRRWDLLSVAAPQEREGNLRRFLRRRFHAAAPEWLTLEQAQKVLNGLKAMAERKVISNQ